MMANRFIEARHKWLSLTVEDPHRLRVIAESSDPARPADTQIRICRYWEDTTDRMGWRIDWPDGALLRDRAEGLQAIDTIYPDVMNALYAIYDRIIERKAQRSIRRPPALTSDQRWARMTQRDREREIAGERMRKERRRLAKHEEDWIARIEAVGV